MRGAGAQIIGQSAEQRSGRGSLLAPTKQEKPSNENISVRVLSPGNGGSVSQSNDGVVERRAGNTTRPSRTPTRPKPETPAGAGAAARRSSASRPTTIRTRRLSPRRCRRSRRTATSRFGSSAPATTVTSAVERGLVERNGREPERDEADGRAGAGRRLGLAGDRPVGHERPGRVRAWAHGPERSIEREHARASAEPRNVGSVSQSNDASSDATAGNINLTDQTADQTQAGRLLHVWGRPRRSSASRLTRSRRRQRSPRPSRRSRRTRTLRFESSARATTVRSSSRTRPRRTPTAANCERDEADCRAGCRPVVPGIQVIGQEAKNGQVRSLSG